jgi:hypothetical protein
MSNGIFVLLISPDALKSENVRTEYEYALELQGGRGGAIVPVLVADVDRNEIPAAFRNLTWLELTRANYEELLDVLVKIWKMISQQDLAT